MTEAQQVEVRLASAAEVRPLRMRVLRAGRPASESVYPYDQLAATLHVAAVDGDQVVGCATVFPEPYEGQLDAWRLRGMAVDEGFQGRGIGSRVMERVTSELVARGVTLLWCNARTVALPFYLRHGFTTVGEEFLAAHNIPHYVALLRLD
jgi:GNAT superfamily N-acetyltransferase